MYTLKQARQLAGITQVEMAEKLGMSEVTYIRYEKYQTVFRLNTAVSFTEVVKIPMSKIIFFEGQLQKICNLKSSTSFCMQNK